MKRTIGLMAALAVLALVTPSAEAQRRGRGGSVNTPYGQFSAAEMAAAGGNPIAAGQIREQKMMLQAEQQMMKQQQLMAKQLKAQQDYLKKHPEAARPATNPATPTRARSKAAPSTKAAGKAATTTPAGTAKS